MAHRGVKCAKKAGMEKNDSYIESRGDEL